VERVFQIGSRVARFFVMQYIHQNVKKCTKSPLNYQIAIKYVYHMAVIYYR
jgi:hypothetical protein